MIRRIFNSHQSKQTIRWLLLVVVLLYGVSGLGITEFRIVEAATFGILTKSLAFKIHDSLLVPFLVLLVLHVCQRVIFRSGEK